MLVSGLQGSHVAAANGDVLLTDYAPANCATGREGDLDALPFFAISQHESGVSLVGEDGLLWQVVACFRGLQPIAARRKLAEGKATVVPGDRGRRNSYRSAERHADLLERRMAGGIGNDSFDAACAARAVRRRRRLPNLGHRDAGQQEGAECARHVSSIPCRGWRPRQDELRLAVDPPACRHVEGFA